jgi:hypothetical protein
MRVAKGLRGGLQEVADDLGVSVPFPPSAQESSTTHTCSPCKINNSTGDANRTFPPGRLRFAPHGVHVLQNARPLLPRAGGLLRIQRQTVRARGHLLADERPARSRARRCDACRARGPPRRWGALGCVGHRAQHPGLRTDAAGSRVRAHGDEWCIHSGYGGRQRRQVALSIFFCNASASFPTQFLSSRDLICSRSRTPLCDCCTYSLCVSKAPSVPRLDETQPLSVPFCSVRVSQWPAMASWPFWCHFFFWRRMIEFKVMFYFVPSVRKGFAMRFTLLDSHQASWARSLESSLGQAHNFITKGQTYIFWRYSYASGQLRKRGKGPGGAKKPSMSMGIFFQRKSERSR